MYLFLIFYNLVPWQTSADGSSNEVFILLQLYFVHFS